MDSSGEIDLNLQPSVEQNSPDHDQSENQQGGDVMEVVSRIYSDYRKLTRMVAEVLQNYTSLHSQLVQYFIASDQKDPQLRKKRKLAEHLGTDADHHDDEDDDNIHAKTMRCSCSGSDEERLRMLSSKPKVSTVFVRVDSSDSSLVVKDGYQWKKYGQKVTRDNPSPRAYFKCSFAPLCPVKKKVQKSAEDRTVLVVTYEGEHTHKKPSSHGSILKPSTIIPSPSINLSPSSYRISSPDHLIRPNTSDSDNHKEKDSDEDNSMIDDQERSSMHRWLVEQMASSLTKDSSFASTLATIISDKVLEQTFC